MARSTEQRWSAWLGIMEVPPFQHTIRMTVTLAFLLCLGAGTVGGVFFAFSTFVMKALNELPASQSVAAMQRINVVVLNPLFLGAFMCTALVSVVSVVAALSWGSSRSLWLLGSGLIYLAGSFVVTAAFNVPRNKRLARLSSESAEAVDYWPTYVREWTRWNHVRTVACAASAACAAGALAS